MDKLRVRLIRERAQDEAAVGAFDSRLVILRIVPDTRMGKEIRLVVLVCEVLRAEHVARLGTEARVEREENLLCDVHGICRCDLLFKLQEITVSSGDVALRYLLLRDGIEAIEEVERGIARGVALARPDSVVQRLGQLLGDKGQDMHCRRRAHLSVALCIPDCSEQRRDGRVGFELRHDRAEEGLERAEVEVEVCTARRFVGSKLSVAGDGGHRFLVSDPGAARHELQCFFYADNRQHKEVRAVLVRGLLIVSEVKIQFSRHMAFFLE